MGFRIKRSIKIAPGIRLNLGKRGTSLSVGGHGLTTNISKKGVKNTVSLPGTGISYTSSNPFQQRTKNPSDNQSTSSVLLGWVVIIFAVWLVYALFSQ